jgi:hypothetical protein
MCRAVVCTACTTAIKTVSLGNISVTWLPVIASPCRQTLSVLSISIVIRRILRMNDRPGGYVHLGHDHHCHPPLAFL